MDILPIGTVFGSFAGTIIGTLLAPELSEIAVESIERTGFNGPVTRALAHSPFQGMCGGAICGGLAGGFLGRTLEQTFADSDESLN